KRFLQTLTLTQRLRLDRFLVQFSTLQSQRDLIADGCKKGRLWIRCCHRYCSFWQQMCSDVGTHQTEHSHRALGADQWDEGCLQCGDGIGGATENRSRRTSVFGQGQRDRRIQRREEQGSNTIRLCHSTGMEIVLGIRQIERTTLYPGGSKHAEHSLGQ